MGSFSLAFHRSRADYPLQFLKSSLHFVLGVDPSQKSNAPLTSDEFVKSFHSALVYSMFRVMLGPLWSLVPKKGYINTCAAAHGFLDHYINQAFSEQYENKSKSLIRSLSAQSNDLPFIRSQVIQAMMAAQDTTSELLTNVLFLLARHPQYWEQLRAELSDTPEESLSAENLLSSKLIQNILLESICTKVPVPH
jgi:cytochrome P450